MQTQAQRERDKKYKTESDTQIHRVGHTEHKDRHRAIQTDFQSNRNGGREPKNGHKMKSRIHKDTESDIKIQR